MNRAYIGSDITYDTIVHDKYFGKRMISANVHSGGFVDNPEVCKKQLVPQYGYIVKNKDGIYGWISGGNNNIGSFIGWCTGMTSWCFNPINMENYIWSPINEAFISKSISCLKDVRLLHGAFYHYYKNRKSGEMLAFYRRYQGNDIVLWEQKT